jgi:hypothetical protein
MAEDVRAKDLRTWNATVLAAVALAATGGDTHTKTARRRVTDRAVPGVSEILGNTPAVARRSYRAAALRPLALGLDDRPRPAAPRRPRSARRTNANRTAARRIGSARLVQRLAGCRAHRRLAVLPAGRSRRMNMLHPWAVAPDADLVLVRLRPSLVLACGSPPGYSQRCTRRLLDIPVTTRAEPRSCTNSLPTPPVSDSLAAVAIPVRAHRPLALAVRSRRPANWVSSITG